LNHPGAEENKSLRDAGQRPWYILLVLLAGLMPATGNIFLFSFAMLSTARDWGVTLFWASVIGFVPKVASPVGGIIFGSLSDRHGRRVALLSSILVMGSAAALSGLSFGPLDFCIYRLLLGMSLGGQWAISMTLVSEVWQPEKRGRAVALVQASFPCGFLYASLLAFWVGEGYSWRVLLMLGALPAILAAPLAYFTIKESRLWMEHTAQENLETVPYREVFRGDLLRHTILGTSVMFIGSFGAWSVNPWIPVYLGQLGIPQEKVPLLTFYIMTAALAGYLLYGFISDWLGRRLTFQIFFLGMAGALASFGFLPMQTWVKGGSGNPAAVIVLLGGLVAFFLGYFSGYGALFAELYPTRVRSRGMGFCYSLGTVGGALGPASTGYLSASLGIGWAFVIASLVFLIGSFLVPLFPETKGKRL
jgi:MFS family permease